MDHHHQWLRGFSNSSPNPPVIDSVWREQEWWRVFIFDSKEERPVGTLIPTAGWRHRAGRRGQPQARTTPDTAQQTRLKLLGPLSGEGSFSIFEPEASLTFSGAIVQSCNSSRYLHPPSDAAHRSQPSIHLKPWVEESWSLVDRR